MNEPLDVERIAEALFTRRVGHPLIYLDSVDSTNRYLLDLHKTGKAQAGTVVLSESQTQGVGRQSRVWYSQRGLGLSFSILLEAEDKQLLSLLAGVAVVLAIRSILKVPLTLRWPNDVYSGSRKLAGILCQTVSKGRAVIVGIGLNVNQSDADFDPSLKNRATSLRLIRGEVVDRNAVLAAILNEIEAQYEDFQNSGRETLLMQYVRFSGLLDQTVRLRLADRVVSGHVVGFQAKGEIVIESSDGRREKYTEGEIIEVLNVARG